MNAPELSLPKVILKSRRALPFFNRHPWVFVGAIQHIPPELPPGQVVDVYSAEKGFIARGLFNPDSNIQVRLYTWDFNEPLDATFWETRIREAIALRHELGYLAPEQGCRLIFSEADGLSGLIVDRYHDWLLVQFTSRALYAHREPILAALQAQMQPQGIWLRTEKGIREAEGLDVVDGSLTGNEPERPLILQENGARFGVDLVAGQKTGFFLDQRTNRQLATERLHGPRVLDMFCYTGGFAIQVARNPGVKEVVAIDVSESALTLANNNAQLNGVAEKIRFQKGDAFQVIQQLHAAGERFDNIILDPPKMARHKKSLADAAHGYERLNRLAMELLPPGGLLLTCSCSGLVDRVLFESILAESATGANRRLQILESRGPAPDHPSSVHCEENQYLKCYLCRVI